MPTNTQDTLETEAKASPISLKTNPSKRRKKRESAAASTTEVTSTATESVLTETAPVTTEEVTSTVTEEPIVTEPVTETAPVVAEQTTSNAAAEPTLTEEVVPPASEEVPTTVTEEPIVTEPVTDTVPVVAGETTSSNAAEGSAPGENTGEVPDHNAIMDPINEDELKNSLATITDFSTKANVLFGYNSRVGLGTLSAETQVNLAETIVAIKDKSLLDSLTNQTAINTVGRLVFKLCNV
jgi:hypothetical protein